MNLRQLTWKRLVGKMSTFISVPLYYDKKSCSQKSCFCLSCSGHRANFRAALFHHSISISLLLMYRRFGVFLLLSFSLITHKSMIIAESIKKKVNVNINSENGTEKKEDSDLLLWKKFSFVSFVAWARGLKCGIVCGDSLLFSCIYCLLFWGSLRKYRACKWSISFFWDTNSLTLNVTRLLFFNCFPQLSSRFLGKQLAGFRRFSQMYFFYLTFERVQWGSDITGLFKIVSQRS